MSQRCSTPHLVGGRRQSACRAGRRLFFETMERRVMLTADALVEPPALVVGGTGGQSASISGSVVVVESASECASHDQSAGMAEVRVQLLSLEGNVLEEITTDQQGNYLFVDLIPGDYTVRQIASTTAMAQNSTLVQNEITAITLQGAQELTDQDFCQLEVTTNALPLAEQSQLAAVLGLVQLNTGSFAQTEFEPINSNVIEVITPAVQLAPLPDAPVEPFYGSPLRSFETNESIKNWNEFPELQPGSTLGLIELANFQQTVEDLLDTEQKLDTALENSDEQDWRVWQDQTSIVDLQQLIGEAGIIEFAAEDASADELTADTTDQVPQVAAKPTSTKHQQ